MNEKLNKIQEYLQQYIKGQDHVIKLISIVLINRDRIDKIQDSDIEVDFPKDELTPPNIMLIGPTGCGKTELVKRISEVSDRFWFRMPCTMLSAVGYHGKNVNDILKYAIESAIKKLTEKHRYDIINNKLYNLLLQSTKPSIVTDTYINSLKLYIDTYINTINNPILQEQLYATVPDPIIHTEPTGKKILLDIEYRQVKDTVKNIIDILIEAELFKIKDEIKKEAIKLVENGIIMLDEIDKICGGKLNNISMYGVQRELLALVEGSTFYTEYGNINTKNILFISAGAFQVVSTKQMIPELRGRFPIKVKLNPLTKDDFVNILKNSRISPLRKYQAIMKADNVNVTFTENAIDFLADFTEQLNNDEQLGARRLWELFDKYLINLYLLDKNAIITKEILQELLPKQNKDKNNTNPTPYNMYI